MPSALMQRLETFYNLLKTIILFKLFEYFVQKLNFFSINVSNIVSISPECLATLYPLLSGAMFGSLLKHYICPGNGRGFFYLLIPQ